MVTGQTYQCPSCSKPSFGCVLDRPCSDCQLEKSRCTREQKIARLKALRESLVNKIAEIEVKLVDLGAE